MPATAAPPAMNPSMSKALAMLATGHTIHATAEHVDWPHGALKQLISKQRGWLIGSDGRVCCPGQPGEKITVPAGVSADDLAWARTIKAAPAAAAKPERPARAPGPISLPIGSVHPSRQNIRRQLGDLSELTASIRAKGLLQPLVVRPHPSKRGEFEVIIGHRRLASSKAAGRTDVPVIICGASDAEMIEMMLIENSHRSGLTPVEKAEALSGLKARGYSNAYISVRTGMAPSTVSGLLALLELDKTSLDKVRQGDVSAADAVAAVRKLRAAGKPGATRRPARAWEPDHLAGGHPLAEPARQMCQAGGHTNRRQLGGVACGECWETVIRQDAAAALLHIAK
ncbi:ParB/RepB/Spo0J family partition protein [Nonomuraea fuscirosea]|uniref:ParB/RepB/Spo0J family partition protein n=1 Tax=Nonomuraea fuscirosea TaxID=1291556 RepID=UPI003712A25A